MKLSQNRADAVQEYLASQGVATANLSALGLGKASPVASNDTDSGRQQNRRVEMVVSGEPIGVGSLQQ
jgi:outer membrane protein OmpA-like peptidoglycan-associated protein